MKKLNFKKAFKYPFNRAKGMLNILWIFLPIIGWFALWGYSIKIIKEFIKGKFEKLPVFEFKDNLKYGFKMCLKSIPFIVVIILITIILDIEAIPDLNSSIISFFLSFFIYPILFINFANKETTSSLFEFKILKNVFNNFWDYVSAMLKNISLGLIFLIMWIILIGIPAGSFTQNIFISDFYRRNVLKKKNPVD